MLGDAEDDACRGGTQAIDDEAAAVDPGGRSGCQHGDAAAEPEAAQAIPPMTDAAFTETIWIADGFGMRERFLADAPSGSWDEPQGACIDPASDVE
jgi:hypothetical protein